MIKFQVVTLFPDYFASPLKEGLLGRALKEGLLKIFFSNPRKFAEGGRVDDYPFGGGDSMIIAYEPLKKSLKSFEKKGYVVCLSPQGRMWTAQRARVLAKRPRITLICGRYGGVDERFVREFADEEISIGDYVLNGGEAAVLVLMESLSRFVPGILGNPDSANKESFEAPGLLEGPQWTRPRHIEGHTIPELLFSGLHEKIKEFRFFAALVLTSLKRPDLLRFKPALQKDLPKARECLKALTREELSSLGLEPSDLEKTDL